MTSKNFNLKSTCKKNFYTPIKNFLKNSTNLTNLQKELSISKQQLNYYLRQLKSRGEIIQKGKGWYELNNAVKNSTKYESNLVKDSSRGHAYIWKAKIEKIPEGWDKRIEVLKNKGINYKLVGAKENTPRIKVLGRKVWLCNNHLRIFDRKDESYYGKTAKESRYIAFQEIKRIVDTLNSKLGISIRPSDILFKREHYALIKNDLAIEENKRGNIWHIKDEEGEWLLVDDSLEKGGELETIGNKAFQTNIPLQNWWNNQKKTNFEVTPSFILETMNGIQQNQLLFSKNIETHISSIKKLGNNTEANTKSIELLSDVILKLKEEVERLR